MIDYFLGISHTPCISMETEITQEIGFVFLFLGRTASQYENILFISFILLYNPKFCDYTTYSLHITFMPTMIVMHTLSCNIA